MINERLLGGDIKPAKEAKDFFDTLLYTGDGSSSNKIQGGAVSGKGAYFDGGSDYVVLPNVAEYDWSPNRSFSVWVKFHSLPIAASTSETRGVMSKTTNAQPYGWVLYTYRDNKKLQFSCYEGTADTTLVGDDVLYINRWYHVVVTDDGTDIKLYIDGVENDSLPSVGENVSVDHTANLFLGRYYHSHSNYESNQTLDQLRWFDKALTQEDVTALYEETGTSETVSVSDFFNDGSDISLHRFEGNFNSEPLNRAAISSSNYFTIPRGVFNRNDDDFTVTMSVKFNTVPTSGYGTFFGRPTGSGNNPIRSYLYYGANDTGVSFEKTIGNNSYYSSQYNTVSRYAFQPDTWYDIAWKYRKEGVSHIGEVYVNGTSLGEFSISVQGSNSSVSENVVLGNDRGSSPFNGTIKNFRYYNKALTDQQVSDVSNGTAPTEDLRVHYVLNGDGNVKDDTRMSYFDGSGDRVTASSAGLPSTGLTISAWINIEQLKTAGVVAWGDEATGERRSLFIWDGGGNNGSYKVWFSGYAAAANVGGSTILQSGTWYHIAVTETGGTAKVYLNGVEDATGSVTLNPYTGTTLRIGSTGSSFEDYRGLIKDVRIYDRAISLEEIEDIYNEREDEIEDISGLVRHYPLNGDSTELVQPSTAVFAGSTSSYITLPVKTIDVGENAKFTLSWWMNADSDHLGFIGEGNADQSFMIHTNTNGVLRVGLTGNPIRLDVSNAYTPGVWAHYMAAFSGTEIKVYKNGAEVGSATGNVSLNGFTNYTLGKRILNNTYGFDGRMRDVRLYSDKLDGTAATALYNETDEPTENLIAHYPLRENAETTSSTDYGYFNGSNAYAQMDSHYSAFHIQTFSVACWVKPQSPSGSTERIASTYSYNGTSYGWLLQIEADKFTFNKFKNNTSHRVRPSLTPQANRWYHIAVTTDGGTSPAKFYIDGVLQTSLDIEQTNSIAYNGSEVSFGAMSWNGGTEQYFHGAIKDLYFYSDVLTETEVGYVMNNNLVPTDNVIAHYPLVSDTQDASGNNRHATGYNIDFQGSLNGTATGVTFEGFDGTDTGVDHSLDLITSGTPFNYNGSNSGASFTNESLNFTPDIIWLKHRTGTGENHLLYNTVSDEFAYPNLNNQAGSGLVKDLKNGFHLLSTNLNISGRDYVAWCWRVGGSAGKFNLDGVGHQTYEECFGTLPSGTIEPTGMSVNSEAGISVIEYNSGSSHPHLVPTGLTEKPDMVIVKVTNVSSAWAIWHKDMDDLDEHYMPWTDGPTIDYGSSLWNHSNWGNDKIGATLVLHGNNNDVIAYCFKSVEGFSHVGEYVGTNASNKVVTGFKPAFVMLKNTDTSNAVWVIVDSDRDPDNPVEKKLAANSAVPENDSATLGSNTQNQLQFDEDGFTLLETNGYINTNKLGDNYVYIAFADSFEGERAPKLAQPVLTNSFKVGTYTTVSGSQSITTGFRPDLVWIKDYEQNEPSVIFDSVRDSAGESLRPTQTIPTYTAYTDSLTSFNDNGFSLGSDSVGLVNYPGRGPYVYWAWKAGNETVRNFEGTVESKLSASDASGFSVVRYTGDGNSSGAKIGHGLSTSPEFIILKNISRSGEAWMVWHKDFNNSQANLLRLNSTEVYNANINSANYRYGDTYDSTVFSVGSGNHEVNFNGDEYMAYVWSGRQGFSSFGTYTGNNNSGDQSITGLGFQPDFLMIKNTSANGNFVVIDSARGQDEELYWNLNNSQSNEPNRTSLDQDGFTVRSGRYNNSGHKFVYAAFKIN